MSTLESIVKIDDPLFYKDPYSIYARLRNEDPVHYHKPLSTWVLTKYDDIRNCARQPDIFSNSAGIFLTDAIGDSPVADDYFAESGELISSLDPPRHSELRRVLAPSFAPPVIDSMEDAIRGDCRDLLDDLEPDSSIDWIASVAEVLPLVVTARLLGLPGDNISDLARWSDELMKFGLVLSDEERAASIEAFSAMNEYMVDQLEAKRDNPGDDVLSVLLSAEIDKEYLSVANILSLATAVLAGGNETTRALLGNMVWAFAQHPDQRQILANDPSLASQAVEETLRWKGPVHGFIRKVSKETELRGKELETGHFIYMLFAAANRDEEWFDEPELFQITRKPDVPNLAFGSGNHQCPGMRLARLEARILLEELIQRFPSWKVTKEPRNIESLFRNGFYDLPVIFSR